MLKWMGKEAHAWISEMFNHVLQHGMPDYWSTNWIKCLCKGGDVNNLYNYRTIMVNLLMAKLFGCMMESNVSAWAKKNGERAYGQVAFR